MLRVGAWGGLGAAMELGPPAEALLGKGGPDRLLGWPLLLLLLPLCARVGKCSMSRTQRCENRGGGALCVGARQAGRPIIVCMSTRSVVCLLNRTGPGSGQVPAWDHPPKILL
eukprot:scaffold270922_cov17-Tisochrysis_lutea.AAC.1